MADAETLVAEGSGDAASLRDAKPEINAAASATGVTRSQTGDTLPLYGSRALRPTTSLRLGDGDA